MSEQFLVVIIGGIAGGLVSYIVSVLRQRAVDRRVFRASALLVRNEIIRNQAAVIAVLEDNANAVERSLICLEDAVFNREAGYLASGLPFREFG